MKTLLSLSMVASVLAMGLSAAPSEASADSWRRCRVIKVCNWHDGHRHCHWNRICRHHH